MKFTESHEWVDWDGQVATIGITEYAQKELGEVVFVELPRVGHHVDAGEVVLVLESTKAAVDIYAPLSGHIVAVNTRLKEQPELINHSPQAEGWCFRLQLDDPAQLDTLR